jgi:hypothetical protein
MVASNGSSPSCYSRQSCFKMTWLNVTVISEMTVTPGTEQKKRTLTNLYNARPTWLDLAHQQLDQAVFAAYGWKSVLSDEEILENLHKKHWLQKDAIYGELLPTYKMAIL